MLLGIFLNLFYELLYIVVVNDYFIELYHEKNTGTM
jgi:hypothetical protein